MTRAATTQRKTVPPMRSTRGGTDLQQKGYPMNPLQSVRPLGTIALAGSTGHHADLLHRAGHLARPGTRTWHDRDALASAMLADPDWWKDHQDMPVVIANWEGRLIPVHGVALEPPQ